ncbi:acyl-CoA thioesterase [Puia sp. P3]|uniref:acyl-CoA thioesterase n=1 Tax=Puia sp. P3 TaxID=3423952 RepID=UPI003D673124
MVLAALLRVHGFTGQSILHFTVMPWDCVIKLMGNDRYHAFMDMGRMDLLLRVGGWHVLVTKKLQPLVHTAHIRYRYPLSLFRPFILRTRLVYIDGTSFWMEHIFECRGVTMATAISKNVLASSDRVMPTRRIMQSLDLSSFEPLYSDQHISKISAVDKILRAMQFY